MPPTDVDVRKHATLLFCARRGGVVVTKSTDKEEDKHEGYFGAVGGNAVLLGIW